MVYHSSLVPFPCVLVLRCKFGFVLVCFVLVLRCTYYFALLLVFFRRDACFRPLFCDHGLDLREMTYEANVGKSS